MRLNATETGKAEKPTWRKRANKQLTTKFRTPAGRGPLQTRLPSVARPLPNPSAPPTMATRRAVAKPPPAPIQAMPPPKSSPNSLRFRANGSSPSRK